MPTFAFFLPITPPLHVPLPLHFPTHPVPMPYHTFHIFWTHYWFTDTRTVLPHSHTPHFPFLTTLPHYTMFLPACTLPALPLPLYRWPFPLYTHLFTHTHTHTHTYTAHVPSACLTHLLPLLSFLCWFTLRWFMYFGWHPIMGGRQTFSPVPASQRHSSYPGSTLHSTVTDVT